MTRPTVVVVGLGPADERLVTPLTSQAIASIPTRFLRTRRHPAAPVVEPAASFDHVYEQAVSLDDVYPAIVEALVSAASEHGRVMYAVPGSPSVAERSVELLCADVRVDVELVPALSVLDLAWVRLRVDPIATSVKIVDGYRFAVDAAAHTGALFVTQCDNKAVLSDIKLAYSEPPERATVLHHLGLPDERVFDVDWAELDRSFEPDHLTSLYFVAPHAAGVELARFYELVERLRRDCPWDREQTHLTLRRHLLEESYEVLEALDGLEATDHDAESYVHLEEELGDLLFQVFFHSVIATENGQFGIGDVARTVHDKLRSRHPHVFGNADWGSSDEVLANWEQLKKTEKNRASIMDGIPRALPALLYASKVQKKAAGEGYVEGGSGSTEVGEQLFALVAAARAAGIDPEDALRRVADAFRARFDQR